MGRRCDATLCGALAMALALAAGCAKPPPSFEDVPPAEELYQEGQRLLEEERDGFWPWSDTSGSIEAFQAIVDNYPYSEYSVLAELAIADAYFADEKYEEALSYYRDFADLHPDHEKVPYTLYRAALCHERRVRTAHRDQTPTRDALILLDLLLTQHPYSEYSDEAERMWRDLRSVLAEQVRRVGDYYMEREEWESAAERYRALLNEFPGLGLDAEALYKLGVCYERMQRLEEASSVYQAVVQNYRDSELAGDAATRLASIEAD